MPGEGEKIPGADLDQLTLFIIDDHFDVRAVLKKHLPAVAARGEHAVVCLFVNGHNGVKFPFSGRNGDAHGDIFGARTVNTVAVNTGVDLTVFAQKGAAHGVVVDAIINTKGLKAVILKTFGSGNAPQRPWLFERLKRLNEQGIIVVNITQCSKGTVEMGRYGTSLQLLQAGVLNGYDCTLESMVTKLMFLLGHEYTNERIIELMNTNIAGEITLAEDV